MIFSPTAVQATLPLDNSIQRFCIALSGGLDSMVLLHALASLKLPVPMMALHINHQISPDALGWQEHCAATCRDLEIPFYSETVTVVRSGRGLEDAAREARYAVFERYLREGDWLLTAHHADDQAETLLLRLMRGAGPRGLAAMARQRSLGNGQLFRPLLDFTRASLESYANDCGLIWVNDESNGDIQYDRNYLRHQITPLLHKRWPDFTRRWQQTAELCAGSEALLDEMAAEDLFRAELKNERQGQSISLSVLQHLSPARRQNLLRYWLRQQNAATPENTHLQQVESQLIKGRIDTEAEVRWAETSLRRYRERLYCVSTVAAKEDKPLSVDLSLTGEDAVEIMLTATTRLHMQYCKSVAGVGYLRADLANLQIRWRKGGERCRPHGRKHSQTLKKLLQEYGLEPWWREEIPLVYSDDHLIAVGDLWVCEGYAAALGQAGYRLTWQFS